MFEMTYEATSAPCGNIFGDTARPNLKSFKGFIYHYKGQEHLGSV